MQPQCRRSSDLFIKVDNRTFGPAATAASAGRCVARSVLLGACLLPVLAGCWKAKSYVEPPLAKPYGGVTLTMACSDAVGHRELVEQLARDWSARSGARVEVLPAGDAGRTPDVRLIAPAELAAYAARGDLQEVPASVRGTSDKYQWAELPSAYADKLLRWGNKAYALPVLGEGQVLIYRPDRFAAASQAYEARYGHPLNVDTWDAFAEAAEFFTEVSKGKPSLTPLPERAEDLDRLFYTVAAPYDRAALSDASRSNRGPIRPEEEDAFFSFHYSLASGNPRLDRPAFVHALALLERMQKCRPAGAAADPARAFRSGEAVMMLATLDELAGLRGADSPVRDRFAVAPIPGSSFVVDAKGQRRDVSSVNRVPYLGWGGWVGTVTSACTRPDAAWDFLSDLGNPVTTSLEIIGAAKWGGGPFRVTHTDTRNRSPWYGYGLSVEQTDKLVEQLRLNLASAVTNYGVRLRTPDEREHMLALARRVREALARSEDPKAAMDDVVKAWKELDAKLPAEKRREAYRKSLGL